MRRIGPAAEADDMVYPGLAADYQKRGNLYCRRRRKSKINRHHEKQAGTALDRVFYLNGRTCQIPGLARRFFRPER